MGVVTSLSVREDDVPHASLAQHLEAPLDAFPNRGCDHPVYQSIVNQMCIISRRRTSKYSASRCRTWRICFGAGRRRPGGDRAKSAGRPDGDCRGTDRRPPGLRAVSSPEQIPLVDPCNFHELTLYILCLYVLTLFILCIVRT